METSEVGTIFHLFCEYVACIKLASKVKESNNLVLDPFMIFGFMVFEVMKEFGGKDLRPVDHVLIVIVENSGFGDNMERNAYSNEPFRKVA